MELLSPRMIKFLGVEEHREAKELLEFNLYTLRILGLWKWDVPQWRFHQAFAFLTVLALILFDITLICDAYLYITDLDHLTKLILYAVITVLLVFKNTYLLIRTDEASALIYQLQNKFFTNERLPTSQQTVILNRYAARAKLYTIIRSNMALGICTFWLLYPVKEMVEEYVKKLDAAENGDDAKSNSNETSILQLPFVTYYPYDVEHNFLYFILTYFYQAFIGLTVFIGMPAWDMLFVSVFIHTSGHFKALQHVLINLHEGAREGLGVNRNQHQLHQALQLSEQIGNDGSSVWTMEHHSEEQAEGRELKMMEVNPTVLMEQKLEEKMHHILSNCIQHHQVILSFMEQLESFLKPVMLMQLLVSMIAFCAIGFQMSVIPIHTESTKFMKLSISLVSALVEQGMFYWFGGELLEESFKTLNAAYHCEWYTADKKFRKHLHILMERAKRPVKLQLGASQP